MIRMLSANDASLLSAGVIEPIYKKEAQHLLNLIENEIRFAAAAGRNKAALLNEEFKGWDAANISDPHDVMSLVFLILSEEGYSFHTEQVLQIGNNASTCSQVHYPHTVVTWPKGAIAKHPNLEATPWCPDDGIAGGFRGAGKTELLTQEAKELLKGHPLTPEERTKIADSLGKDLEYVDPSFAQPTLPTKEAFTPKEIPMPATPVQLIEYLRQKGYKMEGFGSFVKKVHKPTNWDTSRAIAAFVLQLVESHKLGSPKASCSALMTLTEYPDADVNYLRGVFGEVGMMVYTSPQGLVYRWPVTSWDYIPVSPVSAKAGEQE